MKNCNYVCPNELMMFNLYDYSDTKLKDIANSMNNFPQPVLSSKNSENCQTTLIWKQTNLNSSLVDNN
jgi:hypothetical protein